MAPLVVRGQGQSLAELRGCRLYYCMSNGSAEALALGFGLEFGMEWCLVVLRW